MGSFASRTARWIGLVLVLSLLASSSPVWAADDEEGLPGLDGGSLTETDLAEGFTIIVVWASWSPRSRDIGERVAELESRWGERARVITVNFQETAEEAREFARKQRLRVPVYLDREAAFAKRHAVTSLPYLLVVGNGKTEFAGRLPSELHCG